jgi:membrane protein implicated in regulation of membrane protease activity
MAWWTWIVIGGLLLGAELFFIEAEFYLVFIGVAAILSGLLALNAPDLPLWTEWIVFAVLSIVSMVLFRRRVYAALRPQVADRKDDLVDERIRIADDLAPNAECRVAHRGTTWNARNVGATSIASGAMARVVGVDGITLRIQAD